ncbi:FUSC family protein [Microbacterium sp.]|uniref:FUSC family protein n=1 Tax=Microbacterium sp. TaxID=51671 RepID=UPI0039E4A63F
MSLFSFAPSRGPRWQVALQAALGISVPIAVMTIAGQPMLGCLAASGSFTVLYLSFLPAVERVRALPIVAVALIASAALGSLASGTAALAISGLVAVAVASAALAFGFRLGPPGPLFFVLTYGLATHIVGTGAIDRTVYLSAFAAGCLFSYLLSFAPLVFPRVRSRRPRSLREILPGPSLTADGRMLLLRVVLVSLFGALLGLILDPTRTYWVVGSGIAVIGVAAARSAALQRGLHRMLGTIIGAGVYALLALMHPSGVPLALLVGVLQFVVEIIVVRQYAIALVFITPLALLLAGAATGTIGSLDVAFERVVDTLVGAALGTASGVLHPRAAKD